MPQNEGNSNNKQNKTQASKELNAWLPERLTDSALPFAARSPIQVSMPPLIPYIQRQMRHLGESSSLLATWVIGHSDLASTVSRALHLPLLSRTLSQIRRKPAFVPPVWQRMLDLPWFQRHRRRRSFTQKTGAAADRRLTSTISPQLKELHTDIILRNASGIREEQPGIEADETYELAIDETYPSIIGSELLSPPVTKRELLTTANELPHAARDTTLSLHAKQIADRHYPSEPTQLLDVTSKGRPAGTADETYGVASRERYPLISSDLVSPPLMRRGLAIQNLFLSPVTRHGLSDTALELPHHSRATSEPLSSKQIMDGLEAEDSSEFIPSHVGQSSSQIPGAQRFYQISEPDQRETKGAEEGPGQVSQQLQHAYQNKGLLRVLKAITQRMALKRRPTEEHPHITGESITETDTSPIRRFYYPKAIETEVEASSPVLKQTTLPYMTKIFRISASDEATVRVMRTPPTLAVSKQPSILEREGLIHALTARRQPASLGEESERPRPSAIQRTEDSITRPVPDLPLSEAGTYTESTEVLPGELVPQRGLQTGQLRQWEPLISSSLKRIAKKLETTHIAKDTTMGTFRPAMVNLEPPQYGIMGQVFEKEHTGKLPSYLRSPFVVPDVQPSPVQENIQHKTIFSTPGVFKQAGDTSLPYNIENYRFLPGQESLAFLPYYQYPHKEALEMSPLSLVQPKRDFSVASEEGLSSDIANIMLEPAYSWNQGAPEMALAPVGYTPAMASSQIARQEQPEPGGAETGEEATTPDIDDIARDVYRILRRRLVRERERALGY